jgi:hypothetical protein
VNAVEIEQALSDLAAQDFDESEFPFQFLMAFGNKAVTIQRLRRGDSNSSEFPGGVLQRNHIHIAVAESGHVGQTLTALKASPKTAQAKAKFIVATDGTTLEAEELATGDAIACEFAQFPNHFGFFLPLAGISTIKEIKDNPIDVRATGRLNKLYIELLRENPAWATFEHRPDMNHFMARLVFCFFAEDTDIFPGASLFTATVDRMSERDGSNVHEVLETIFRAMNTKSEDRAAAKLPRWATEFPYVNGGLFSGSTDAPRFTRTARSYLYQAGQLDWKAINPDIFGSMIQAVADDEERGALGMHYTSVPNILKVLNPLFLDDLRAQLEAAGDNKIKLLNLRKRMAHIRVFDPACGSGNFLVIAYKQMREIEAQINRLRKEANFASEIPINNFRGIELRDFPAEIARLALIIAEFQCDVLYRGQKEALTDVLPLDSQNWITCGNALRLDWLAICPPTGTGVKLVGDDLFNTPLDQSEIDFENEGGETYICGNPPYLGTKYQSAEQKDDLKRVFQNDGFSVGNLDYVGGWVRLGAQYVSSAATSSFAFVSTTSLFQGEQADIVYRLLKGWSIEIAWCHSEFKWDNQAANNAGVSCCIVGMSPRGRIGQKRMYDEASVRVVTNIGPYLIPMPDVVVGKWSRPLTEVKQMTYGSMSNDSGAFTLSAEAYRELLKRHPSAAQFVLRAFGGNEFVNGLVRYAIYVEPGDALSSTKIDSFDPTFERIKRYRGESARAATRKLSELPMCFAERRHEREAKLFIPQIFSERREYVTVGLLAADDLVIAPHMQVVGADLCAFSLLSSRIHLMWVATVCGKLESRIRYSNTLGWNTFPVPTLTEQNKADLATCAQEILLAREAHYPATIADLYDPERMPDDLRRAHEKNDEVLERIYIGRKFKNDTERLEKLFDLYTKMTASQAKPKKGKSK